VGPKLAGGTLVLLGGRRALLGADGSAKTPERPGPTLREIALVPLAKGSVLVGLDTDGLLHRFDEPLGEGVVLGRVPRAWGRTLGSAPGKVVVFPPGQSHPLAVDVATKTTAELASPAGLPPRDVEFVDGRRGAAIVGDYGVAVTTDGGATWTLAAGQPPERDRPTELEHDGERIFARRDRRVAEVDVDKAALGVLSLAAPSESDPATVRFLARTLVDPLALAATDGLRIDERRALVGAAGRFATIDLATGVVLELESFASELTKPCDAVRWSTTEALFVCGLGEGRRPAEETGVFAVELARGGKGARRVGTTPSQRVEARSSGSGATLLSVFDKKEVSLSRVTPEAIAPAITLPAEAGLEGGVGPTRDGLVALATEGATPALVRLDEKGKKKSEVTLPEPVDAIDGFVEENADGSLQAFVRKGPAVLSLHVTRDGKATLTPMLESYTAHHGRGLTVSTSPPALRVTVDGGATWADAPLPVPPSAEKRPARVTRQLAASEVGLRLGDWLRVGWGEPAPFEPRGAHLDAGELKRPTRPSKAAHELSCTLGASAAGPAVLGADAKLFEQAVATKTPVKKGSQRRIESTRQPGAFPVVVALEEEAPAAPELRTLDVKHEPAPTAWKLSWVDGTELAPRIRTASVKVPAGARWGTSLVSVAAEGERLLAGLSSGGKRYLVRARAGQAELVELKPESAPSGADPVAFGQGRDELSTWAHQGRVLTWKKGGAPLLSGTAPKSVALELGTPAADGTITALVGLDGLARALSFAPPRDEADARATTLPRFDAYKEVSWGAADVPALAPCDRKSAGPIFVLSAAAPVVVLEGGRRGTRAASYRVRFDGTKACLAGVTVKLDATSVPALSTATSTDAVLRFDFGQRKADASQLGEKPKTFALKCEWPG
jgi:hypothetical protein